MCCENIDFPNNFPIPNTISFQRKNKFLGLNSLYLTEKWDPWSVDGLPIILPELLSGSGAIVSTRPEHDQMSQH